MASPPGVTTRTCPAGIGIGIGQNGVDLPLFGQINFELFHRFDGVIDKPELLFEHAVAVMATALGIHPTRKGHR
jgi:hypothetical protein